MQNIVKHIIAVNKQQGYNVIDQKLLVRCIVLLANCAPALAQATVAQMQANGDLVVKKSNKHKTTYML